MEPGHHLNNLYLLVRILDAGSFTAAAREMGTTRSFLTRHVQDLEQNLGTRLLHRDARRLSATKAGEKVYRQAILMTEHAHAAMTLAHESGDDYTLRLGASDALAMLLAGPLVDFSRTRSKVRFVTHATHDAEALLNQKVDMLLQMGPALPDNAGITVYPLARLRWVMVASPRLLQRSRAPQHPDEIAVDQRLAYVTQGNKPGWLLRGTKHPQDHWRLTTSHFALALAAARAGWGYVQLPLFVCLDDFKTGHLQWAFEAFEPAPIPLYALRTRSSTTDERATRFLNHVRKTLATTQGQGILPAQPI